MKLLTNLTKTVTAPPTEEKAKFLKCPPAPGYELFPGLGYYKYHSDRRNWQQAVDTCDKEGTHLMILNSKAEVLDSMMEKRKAGDQFHWVGIHDHYAEGRFITILSK